MGKIFAIIREKFLGGGNAHALRHRLEKKDKDTFLIVFFSLVRKERKGQKEERNSSFKHLLSPRGDQCEQSAPTVPL